MSKAYKFKSGYTISARDDYNPRLFDLTVEAFREGNPAPEPPIKTTEVKVKGGMKEIEKKDWNDPAFIEAYNIWNQSITNESHLMLLRMAADPDSIDKEMLNRARVWGSDNGVPFPEDDLRAYLQIVTDKGEIGEFFKFLNELEGPKGALVNSFIDIFRGQNTVQGSNGVDMGHTNSRRTVPRMAGTPTPDDGEGSSG